MRREGLRGTGRQELRGACQRQRAEGIPLDSFFSCQGKPSKLIGISIYRAIFKDPDEWAACLAEVRTHSTKEDLEKARGVRAGGSGPGRLNTSAA